MTIGTKKSSEWKGRFLQIDISIKLIRKILQTPPLHPCYLTYNYAFYSLNTRCCCETFFRSTTSYKKPRQNQLLASESEDGKLWKVWDFRTTYSCHSEKRQQSKVPQHLPRTLAENNGAKSMMKSLFCTPSLCFKISRSASSGIVWVPG